VGGVGLGDGAVSEGMAGDGAVSDGAGGERVTTPDAAESCARCFPAGTLVATARGEQPIQALHVGDTVLSEDPHTGRVDSEPVQRVIVDPASSLIAVNLSDGSAITVTADHPFWLDSGVHLSGPGWLSAGQLRVGDRLRTASGADAIVTAVRGHVGCDARTPRSL